MSSDDTERTSFFERRSQSDCVHEQVAKADCEYPRGCAVILRRICQLSLTRITHQVSRVFDLKYIEPQWHGSYLISTDNTVATAASFIAARFLAGNRDRSGCNCANRSFCHSGTVRNRFPLYFLEHCHESDGNISQHIDRKCEHIADFSVPCHMDMFPLS